MVVQHNNTELTRLRASSATDRRLIYFDYSAAEEQLSAAIRQSEHCEQELSYRCKKSRLLNTPGRHRAQWKTHTCDPLVGNQTLDWIKNRCINNEGRLVSKSLFSLPQRVAPPIKAVPQSLFPQIEKVIHLKKETRP